jgi:short-subunit dehydrogenase
MGLGLELARLFAADGHDLILTARSTDRLEALAAALRKDFEVDVHCVSMDLTLDDAVPQLLQVLADEGLGVRVLVNNAGFGVYGPYTDRRWRTYREMIDLNITALAHLTHALLPGIRQTAAEHPGRVCGIMNVASTAAFQPGPLMAAYFASKAFVLSFTEALHEEMRGTGLKVSAFCPGPTRTDFFTTDVMVPSGAVTEADLAEYHRRQNKRMDAGTAARIGYQGFLAGRAVVIPGRLNRFQAWLAPRMPRAMVRRITHRMLQK